jgi:molecular chaperone HscB
MSETKTYFDVFDLPLRYALDLDDLERRYRERSRHWHPDRFSRAPASERAAVLMRATDLNAAYRALKSDARRAEYLLRLLTGIDLGNESNQHQVAPEFLTHILELREALMEARSEKDSAAVHALATQVSEQVAALRPAIAAGFARLESGDPSTTAELVAALLAQRYYQRFNEEIAAYEEAQAAQNDLTLAVAPPAG